MSQCQSVPQHVSVTMLQCHDVIYCQPLKLGEVIVFQSQLIESRFGIERMSEGGDKRPVSFDILLPEYLSIPMLLSSDVIHC